VRACRSLGSLTLALVALLDVVVVRPAAAQTTPQVTASDAKGIVKAFNQAHTANNDKLDVAGQFAIEVPPIQTIDDATYRDAQGRGQTTLGEKVKIDRVQAYVPRQAGYPLQFLASERLTPAQGDRHWQMLVFVKANESDPWKLAMAALLLPGLAVPKVDTSSDGLAILVESAAGSLRAKPDALAAGLAGLYNAVLDGKRATTKVFKPGPLTTDAAARIAQQAQATRRTGASAQLKFQSAEFAPVAYQSAKGSAIVLFVVAFREVFDAAPGGSLKQPPTQDAYGGLVAPGNYSEVRLDHAAIFVAWVPKRASKNRVEVLGIYEGTTKASADASPAGSAPSG
jgi:hypothetical protein